MCALEIKGVFNGSEVNEVIDDQFVMDKPDLEGRIRRGFRGSPRDFGGGMKITAIRHGEMVLPDGNIVYINMPAGRIDLDPGQKMILRFRGEVVRLKGVQDDIETIRQLFVQRGVSNGDVEICWERVFENGKPALVQSR